MRIAIMQPTYLPWMGYFDLMDQVDAFVVLDTVQFVRQSWQNRNRIKTAQGVKWLTLPIEHAFGAEIRNIRLRDDVPWRRDHFETIRHSYARAAHWAGLEPELRIRYEMPSSRLLDINGSFISWMALKLGIDLAGPGPGGSRLLRASQLQARGRRQDLLVAICHELGADEYLSPPGSAAYLSAHDPFPEAGVRLYYHSYDHPEYPQLHGAFVPFMSALDVIVNHGPAAPDILRSGRRPPLLPEALHASPH